MNALKRTNIGQGVNLAVLENYADVNDYFGNISEKRWVKPAEVSTLIRTVVVA